jgi:hypothetical protein
MLSHTSIETYYHTNFALVQHHKWSLTEIENMIPFELDLYAQLLVKHLEDEMQRHEREMRKYS